MLGACSLVCTVKKESLHNNIIIIVVIYLFFRLFCFTLENDVTVSVGYYDEDVHLSSDIIVLLFFFF